jgi:serine/threonine protein kinase
MHHVASNVEELFNAALELKSSEARSAFLDRACGDTELRRRVERLLALDPEAMDFLEAPAAMPTVTADPSSRPVVEEPGTVLGPYRLLEPIGEGGMGVVYVAEQTHPVRRRVALKIIKPGMDSKQVVARFEAERQALAMMDHPNIAKVHDAGTTASGRPYFVMELVRGIPITAYCDREHLSISERLELFVLVCRAVQHAHQKGIIHRDLKPSNILVTVIDGAAVPKIIDFGVAKATGGALTDRTLYTAFHQFIGTPFYMSPEQADLSGTDVDTRSDIYALGVLLYELLTGTTPFDTETLKRAAFDELRRIIREEEPPKPSTRLSSLGETASTISAQRKADPKRLGSSFRGELDWIVMKALEKDRRRRYETANDFAGDVMNFLTDKPVEACPPSAWYRFKKYARRHRAAMTTGSLFTLVLIIATAVSVWQAGHARRAEHAASARADELRGVVQYLVDDVFAVRVPNKPQNLSMTLGELLEQADATIGDRLRRQPLVEARVRMALSAAYAHSGHLDRAGRHLSRVIELRKRHLGPAHPDTLEALHAQSENLLSSGYGDRSKWEAGLDITRRLLVARRRVLGPSHSDTLLSQAGVAYLLFLLDRIDEAEAEGMQAESLAVRALGPDHPTTLIIWRSLADILVRRGDFERAEALGRRAYAGLEQVLGPLHEDTLLSLKHLGGVLFDAGHLDAAREVWVEGARRYCQVFGPTHINCSYPMQMVFRVLGRQGDYVALRDYCEEWLHEVLALPPDSDAHMRSRRSIRLYSLLFQLITLPQSVPLDSALLFQAAEDAEPHGANALMLALIYCQLGDLNRATACVSDNAEREAKLDAWHRLVNAIVLVRRGEMDKARREYDLAVEYRKEETGIAYPGEFERIRAEAATALGLTELSNNSDHSRPATKGANQE